MKKLLLLLVLCLFSCGTGMWQYHDAKAITAIHPLEIPVWVDSNFNKGNKEAVIRAIDEWNYSLNGQAELVFSGYVEGKEGGLQFFHEAQRTGLGIVLLNLDSEDEELDGTPANVLAFVNGSMSHVMVVVNDHIGGRELKDIVLHEFGHVLGADHVYAPSLMFPTYGSKQLPCVDKITMLQVATYLELDPEAMRYCKVPNMP